MIRIALFVFGIVLFTVSGFGQNKYIPPDPYSLGSNKLHFSKYLITSSGYFGPNALPVPRLANASVTEELWIDIEYEHYQSVGERTHDVLVDLRFPVAKGKASFVFSYIPFEFYRVDSALSRIRRSESGEALQGSAHGDVYFGARAQLIKNKAGLPDVAFGMYAKTASGTMVEDVRFTDTPGYYFDLSFGKSHFFRADSAKYLRWYGLLGFYVWQTYLDNYPQNDALFYGCGLEVNFGRVGWVNTLRGYNGYMFNGDHPLVYRSELRLSQGAASLILGYEYGIRDYPFSCFRAGVRLNGFDD